ncbi:uncharacterized protein M421DRAFT_551 [Didymella exigua CBS 183.55]|uniref:Uncharacterized protein n=1 Tax=Didymella exigua CBS 183.55 TaxID=1150837 RepID=A0A6A5S4A8_9PLEO|nr:uncharacterized protein M421DRAFT_551 [Didymella exigua CBS 183.55]KAF1934430.1 hypothetical protein M421DRAFT_551 [Didymella exigua CBS 183.55]
MPELSSKFAGHGVSAGVRNAACRHWIAADRGVRADTSESPSQRLIATPMCTVQCFQNLGLITFISQGLAIAWWRKVMQGSSLSTLHRNHAYSYSFYSTVTSGKHFNIVALAALVTKFDRHSGGLPGEDWTIKTVDSAWAGVINAYDGKIANGRVRDLLGPNQERIASDL